VRVGFSDYKILIHAATDNPFLPYYNIAPEIVVLYPRNGNRIARIAIKRRDSLKAPRER